MKAIVSLTGEVRSVELPDDTVAPNHKHLVVDYFADPLPLPDPTTHAVVDFGNVVTFGGDGLPVSVKRTYSTRELTTDEKEERDLSSRVESLKQLVDALDAGSLTARQAQQVVAHIVRIIARLWRTKQ